MSNILFVCLGNICRSPMAEAIFNKLARERGLDNSYSCTSAGTAGYHIGEQADFRTRIICEMNHAPLDHRGRKVCKEDLVEFDLILTMDESNLLDVMRIMNVDETNNPKVRLLRSYEPDGTNKEIPDPYYGDLDDFKNVYAMLVKSCTSLLDELTASTNE